MKLRNKKTGEIVVDGYVRETHDFQFDGQKHILAVFKSNGHRPPERVSGAYRSLAELNEEWEDAPEEPKEYYFIRDDGSGVGYSPIGNSTVAKRREAIGNYFETYAEAEKAVEKLKAWKRLKDKGFKIDLWEYDGAKAKYQERISTGRILFRVKDYGHIEENDKDLDLLFGGEE